MFAIFYNDALSVTLRYGAIRAPTRHATPKKGDPPDGESPLILGKIRSYIGPNPVGCCFYSAKQNLPSVSVSFLPEGSVT